jgi:hypothetical protein
MKKLIIVTAACLVLIGLGYLVYSKLILQTDPCARIFDQTTFSLAEKTKLLTEKGAAILGSDQIQTLSGQSEQITADLKTCCILFHDERITFDEFLKCQDDFSLYERSIDRLVQLLAETQVAKQQQRDDIVNLRLSYIERNVRDLGEISDQLQAQVKSLMGGDSREYPEPARITPQAVITESEPNDSYKQGMEISSGSLTGTLSEADRQDYFRFEVQPGSILNLDLMAGDEGEKLKIALRNFEGDELWNSGGIGSGDVRSTRILLNNLSGGIYYAVVYDGIGSYKLHLYIETQNDAGSATDAGDKISKALAIEPDHSYSGEMGAFDEEDWYRFDIPAGHILKLSFAPAADGEAMKFSLRSFERSEVWYSGVIPAGETMLKRVMMNNSSGGTYYLQAYYGSGGYGFEIFIESQNDAGSGTDAGDKIAEALKITPGRSFAGQLGGYDESDWYRFDIPPGSVIRMTLSNDPEGTPLKFALRNVNGIETWQSEELQPGTQKTMRMLVNNARGGIYFLEAFDGSGPYEFGIFLEKQNDAGLGRDAGDRIADATKISSERIIEGEVGGLDPEDWYTFSLREGRVIQFTTDRDGEPLRLSMGSVARKKIIYTAELTPGAAETFEVPKDMQPPYFLNVYGGGSKYRFEIQ